MSIAISVRTVETYRSRVMLKINAPSLTILLTLQFAIRLSNFGDIYQDCLNTKSQILSGSIDINVLTIRIRDTRPVEIVFDVEAEGAIAEIGLLPSTRTALQVSQAVLSPRCATH